MKTPIGAIVALLLAVTACSGSGSNAALPHAGTAPTAAVTTTSTLSVTNAGETQALPVTGGISTSVTFAANNAPAGTTLSVTISTGSISGMPSLPATSPDAFVYYAITPSADITLTGVPSFSVRLPSAPHDQGQFYAWTYTTQRGWTDWGPVSVTGSALAFGGSSSAITMQKNVTVFIVPFSAQKGASCPTPTPSPTASPGPTFAPQYRLIRLPDNYRVNKINNNGVVAGDYYPTGSFGCAKAATYKNGQLQTLGILPNFRKSTALDLNDKNQVVGFSYDSVNGAINEAMLFTGGHLYSLPAATANAINNTGVIAGVDAKTQNVVLIDAESRTVLLFPFDPNVYSASIPDAINDSGQYVGAFDSNQAYLAQGSTIEPLGFAGFPQDINAPGDIVGDKFAGETQPFIRDHRTGAYSVPLLPGDTTGIAIAINDRGQVVGFSGTASSSPQTPFIYQHGQIASLQQLIGQYVSPADINNKGEILVLLNHDKNVLFSAGILEPKTTLP